jgi:hypothetical protein
MRSMISVLVFFVMVLLFIRPSMTDTQFVSRTGEVCGCLPYGEYDIRLDVGCEGEKYDVVHVSTCK